MIQNHKAIRARACCELIAQRRWCLTGTPIQNGVDDLYSLFKFLGRIASPYNVQATYKSKVTDPVKRGRGLGSLRVILPVLMLRRTKLDTTSDGKPLLTLPGRHVEVIKTKFMDADEQSFYDATKDRISLTFNKFAKQGEVMSSYVKVLVLLLRLRQGAFVAMRSVGSVPDVAVIACLHPRLVTKGEGSDALEATATGSNQAKDEDGAEVDALADMLSGVKVDTKNVCMVCQRSFEGKAKLCGVYAANLELKHDRC